INMDDFGRCVIRTGDEASASESQQQFRALKRRIDNASRELIGEAIADGSLAPTDPKSSAFTIAGALNWPARWHDPDGEHAPADLAEYLVTNSARGYSPR
ncbi:hypothetical protein OY671_007538, partial [Metschnikowia pulcherrima]